MLIWLTSICPKRRKQAPDTSSVAHHDFQSDCQWFVMLKRQMAVNGRYQLSQLGCCSWAADQNAPPVVVNWARLDGASQRRRQQRLNRLQSAGRFLNQAAELRNGRSVFYSLKSGNCLWEAPISVHGKCLTALSGRTFKEENGCM